MNVQSKFYLAYYFLITLLSWGTGIVSDDFSVMDNPLDQLFIPSGNYLNIPLAYFFEATILILADLQNYLLVEVFKIFYLCLSFYMISKFFTCFLNQQISFLISFIFIFFPTHDASTYWIMGQYLILSCAFILYAYYWLEKEKGGYAIASILIGSFTCYGSPAIVFGVLILLIYQKRVKDAIVIFIPHLLYCLYYLYTSEILKTFESRIQIKSSLSALIKSLAIQVGTFIDSTFGPSFFLKIGYSIIDFPILLILPFLVYSFLQKNMPCKILVIPKPLLIFAISVVTANLLMFAITGRYPQICFNLGNRVTTYSTFIFLPIFYIFSNNRKVQQIFLSIVFTSIVGISLHWKFWSYSQNQVINDLAKTQISTSNNILLVSHHQYSKLGPFSHIEFLSEHWVSDAVITGTGHSNLKIYSLSSKRFILQEKFLIDRKYKTQQLMPEIIYVYDTSLQKLLSLNHIEFNEYLNSLKPHKRHWVQFIENERWKNLLKRISPRIEYSL